MGKRAAPGLSGISPGVSPNAFRNIISLRKVTDVGIFQEREAEAIEAQVSRLFERS